MKFDSAISLGKCIKFQFSVPLDVPLEKPFGAVNVQDETSPAFMESRLAGQIVHDFFPGMV